MGMSGISTRFGALRALDQQFENHQYKQSAHPIAQGHDTKTEREVIS
jgi:hypothetical protein